MTTAMNMERDERGEQPMRVISASAGSNSALPTDRNRFIRAARLRYALAALRRSGVFRALARSITAPSKLKAARVRLARRVIRAAAPRQFLRFSGLRACGAGGGGPGDAALRCAA